MQGIFYQDIIKGLPFGYAYCRIINSSEEDLADIIVMDVNNSLLRILEAEEQAVKGKRITELLPLANRFEWKIQEFLNNINEYHKGKIVDKYVKSLDKWMGIQFFPINETDFVALLLDTTKEKADTEKKNIILKKLNDIVFLIAEDLTFIDVIVDDEEYLFMPREMIIGKPIKLFFPKEVFDSFEYAFTKAKQTKRKQAAIYKSPLPGDFRWYKAEVNYVLERQDYSYVVRISDITQGKITQDSLIEKTEELEHFFSINLDLLAILDLQGNYIKVNGEWEKIIGYFKNEIEKQNFKDFIHPEDVEVTLNMLEAVLNTDSIIEFKNRFRCSDGSVRNLEWRAQKKSGFIYAAARDITQRLEEEYVQKIMLGFSDYFIGQFKMLDYNKIAEDFKYISKAAYVTINLFDENSANYISTGMAGDEKYKQQGDYRKIDIVSNQAVIGDICYVMKSKRIKVPEDILNIFARQLGLAIVNLRNEQLLRNNEEKYRMIVDNSPLGIIYYGNDGIIKECNDIFVNIIGSSRKQLIGLNMLKLPDEKMVSLLMESLLGKQMVYEGEYAAVTSNKIIPIRLLFSPIINEDNKVDGGIGIVENITERRKMEREIFREKEKLQTTLLSIGDGVIATCRQGRIEIMNSVAEEITGWTAEESVGRDFSEVFKIIDEKTRKECESPVELVMQKGEIIELKAQTILIAKDNTEIAIEDSAAPIKDENGMITGVVVVFRDYTEKREKQKEILFLSYYDQLTEVYNRRFFEEEVKRLDTPRNYPITFAMLDVNGLKLMNDAFGHSAGDEVLKKVAASIKNACRADDIIARIGGDEFAMILPKTTFQDADDILKRIMNTINTQTVKEINLSVSYGADTKKTKHERFEDVFNRAEDIMYKRKLHESKAIRHNTIEVILDTLYEKSIREKEHSQRVSDLCGQFARVLNMDKEDIDEIVEMGLLHDIGKITIDLNLLDKAERLYYDESIEMEKHSEAGYHILKSLNEYSAISEYVLSHHERWDGSGYPQGLKGEDIPVNARILAIADSYEAMISERPYKSILTQREAIEEIKLLAGTQYDPKLAIIFIENVIKGNIII